MAYRDVAGAQRADAATNAILSRSPALGRSCSQAPVRPILKPSNATSGRESGCPVGLTRVASPRVGNKINAGVLPPYAGERGPKASRRCHRSAAPKRPSSVVQLGQVQRSDKLVALLPLK